MSETQAPYGEAWATSLQPMVVHSGVRRVHGDTLARPLEVQNAALRERIAELELENRVWQSLARKVLEDAAE